MMKMANLGRNRTEARAEVDDRGVARTAPRRVPTPARSHVTSSTVRRLVGGASFKPASRCTSSVTVRAKRFEQKYGEQRVSRMSCGTVTCRVHGRSLIASSYQRVLTTALFLSSPWERIGVT